MSLVFQCLDVGFCGRQALLDRRRMARPERVDRPVGPGEQNPVVRGYVGSHRRLAVLDPRRAWCNKHIVPDRNGAHVHAYA